MKNSIAEYTNSQNAISPIDLKSVNKIQIELERYLKSENILYIRKAGDIGDGTTSYDYRISMEKFTQILYACQGYPERVSNVKKRLFLDYYDEIYDENNFKIEQSKALIELYFNVENSYKAKKIKKYDQKVFYIIYIMTKNKDMTIEKAISFLDSQLENYDVAINEPRKLLRVDFKKKLEHNLDLEKWSDIV